MKKKKKRVVAITKFEKKTKNSERYVFVFLFSASLFLLRFFSFFQYFGKKRRTRLKKMNKKKKQ